MFSELSEARWRLMAGVLREPRTIEVNAPFHRNRAAITSDVDMLGG